MQTHDGLKGKKPVSWVYFMAASWKATIIREEWW